MLKNVILCGAAAALFSGTAFAADLPSRLAPPVYPPPPSPVFTWTGFYLGVNAGDAFADNNPIRTSANDAITASQLTTSTVPSGFSRQASGFTGGGQIGYNYQFPVTPSGGFVLGVEADAAYTDLESPTYLGAFGVRSDYHSGLDYLGTVRGRAGIVFDRALFYATGGFAYGQTSYGQTILPNVPGGSPIWAGSRSSMQTGYAVGGGLEYALPTGSFLNVFGAGAVTVKAEYLHYDLGSQSFALTPGPVFGPAGTSFTDRVRTSGNIVRFGLNYKFGSAPVPVVARY